MSAITSDRTVCDQCGRQRGPLNADKQCEVCAASWNGYNEGRTIATLLSIGYAIERALEDAYVTPEQVRAIVELAVAGQTHPDSAQEITEGHMTAPTSGGVSDEQIDGMMRLLGSELQDTHLAVTSARRVGQPIDKALLSRRLQAALDGIGGGQWLKDREA
jgi:hypothetical protein